MLVAVFVASFVAAFPEADWEEILRDAMITNQSELRDGHAKVLINYSAEAGKHTVVIESEITWSGANYYQRYRFKDPTGVFLSSPDSDEPIEKRPWNIFLKNEDEFIAYNPANNLVKIFKSDDHKVVALLQIHPRSLWLRCCPPRGADGRPWEEMLKPLPSLGKGGKLPTVVFSRIDRDLIQQTRSDADGGELKIQYSLSLCSSPISCTYTSGDANVGNQQGKFRWEKLGNACILKECTYDVFTDNRSSKIDSSYKVIVQDVDLRTPPAHFFSRSRLLNTIAPGATIEDGISNKRYKLNKGEVLQDMDLRKLSDYIRSSKFLQKR